MISLFATTLSALIDTVTTGTVSWLFAIAFVLVAACCAWLVRRECFYSAVVVPPLAYAAGLVLAAAIGTPTIGDGVLGRAATVIALLATDPVPLFVGVLGAGCVIAGRMVLTAEVRHRLRSLARLRRG